MADELAFESLSGGVATLIASDARAFNFWRTRLQALSDALTAASGGEARLRVEVRPAPEPAGAAAARPVPDSVAHAEAAKDPLVRRAMELFGARLIEVRDEKPQGRPASGPASANDDAHESPDAD